jgi:hypothetical protein
MTDQPYDPGPVPAAVASEEVMAAARTAFMASLTNDLLVTEALERAVTAALAAMTVETYAVLVEQGIDERTRRAEDRLAKVIATARTWASSGTADQRKAGRMLLSDLGHS